MTFGTFLRDRRLAEGWTQEQVAARSGGALTAQEVSNYEQLSRVPRTNKRRALARALGLRHIDLIVAAGWLDPGEVPGGEPVVAVVDELGELSARLDPDARATVLRLVRDLAEREARRAEASRPSPAVARGGVAAS